MRQRVREGYSSSGKRLRLVQELRRLQPRQARGHRLLGQPGNVPQQRERDIDADDRRRLQQVPLRRGSRSIRAASTACTVAGICSVAASVAM